MKTLRELFLHQLAEMYDSEKRLVKGLSDCAKLAQCEQLSAALHSHAQESQGHVSKLEQVFEALNKKPRTIRSDVTLSLLRHCKSLAHEFHDSPCLDAALICAAQKIEHHEIATYGCLYQWAGLLENEDAADVLAEILAEEKAADEALNIIAVLRNDVALEKIGSENAEDLASVPMLVTRLLYTPPGSFNSKGGTQPRKNDP